MLQSHNRNTENHAAHTADQRICCPPKNSLRMEERGIPMDQSEQIPFFDQIW